MNIDTYILLLLIILFPTSHAFCNHPQIHNLHTHKRPQTAFCFYARHSSDMESRILSLETRLCGEIFSHVPMESTIVDIVNQLQQNSQEGDLRESVEGVRWLVVYPRPCNNILYSWKIKKASHRTLKPYITPRQVPICKSHSMRQKSRGN